ncbi:MAG: flagellar motor protein MotB, partial [Geminicoccaceae bacterium]
MAKDEAPAGAPMWMVTFADLMSLLVCFFVLLISFSVPDTKKIKIVAGSMNDAFGFTKEIIVTGMIEIEGNPQYRFAKDVTPLPLDNVIGPIDDDGRDVTRLTTQSAEWQDLDEALAQALEESVEEEGFEEILPEPLTEEQKFEEIEEKLTDAIRESPELRDLAGNVAIQHVQEGLKIQMIDQARKSMFPLGSADMYAEATDLLSAVVASIQSMPNKVWITGHTDSLLFSRSDGYDNWSLSVDRANATRKTLLKAGLDPARIASVIGKGDTEHLIEERPADPRNRRISITLLRETPLASPQTSPVFSVPPRGDFSSL